MYEFQFFSILYIPKVCNLLKWFVAINEPVYIYDANADENYYLLKNDQNTVLALYQASDITGSVPREQYEYSSYGITNILDQNGLVKTFDHDLNVNTPEVKKVKSDFSNPFGYQGMWRDEHTGLYHTHYRLYDPQHVRWLTPDPAGYQDGQNLYRFYSGPNGVDVLGLADLAGHVSLGLSLLKKLNIKLKREELNYFLSGLIYPDFPFDALKRGDEAALVIAFAQSCNTEREKLFEEFKDELSHINEAIKIGKVISNIDDNLVPYCVVKAGEYTKEKLKVDEISYWWGQNSIFTPYIRDIPGVNNVELLSTHYGEKSYMHFMASGLDDDPIKIGKSAINASNESINLALKLMKEGNNNDAFFEIGKVMHTLTDSWMPSHVERNPSGEISLIQPYPQQNVHAHSHIDKLSDKSLYNVILSEMAKMAHAIEASKSTGIFDSSPFFKLSKDVKVGVAEEMKIIPFTEVWKGKTHEKK